LRQGIRMVSSQVGLIPQLLEMCERIAFIQYAAREWEPVYTQKNNWPLAVWQFQSVRTAKPHSITFCLRISNQ
jgi:hypothetical protein